MYGTIWNKSFFIKNFYSGLNKIRSDPQHWQKHKFIYRQKWIVYAWYKTVFGPVHSVLAHDNPSVLGTVSVPVPGAPAAWKSIVWGGSASFRWSHKYTFTIPIHVVPRIYRYEKTDRYANENLFLPPPPLPHLPAKKQALQSLKGRGVNRTCRQACFWARQFCFVF